MTEISRRTFSKIIGAGAAAGVATSYSTALYGKDKPRVVVIGGGAGGATAARYIAKDSKGAIDVTLIEPSKTYTTCFFSNLYIGGFRDLKSIQHGYDKLSGEYGIKVVHDMATGVDRKAKTVTVGSGDKIPYDRLIIAPGIDLKYDSVEGYSAEVAEIMPHAWKAGPQTTLLKKQIEAMPKGGTFAMVAPPNPYRCPPGPYERISMVAHVLKKTNPTAKIVVLDPKEKFSKQALFMEGWEKYYGGMVEWLPASMSGGVKRIDPKTMEIVTDLDTIKADVCNVIPAQQAGKIAQIAGVTNEAGWCPIKPATMQSTMDENIHVIGDASIAKSMPKSGFAANSQAKVAAMAVRAALTGSKAFPPRFANTCWSLIATDDAVKVGARYKAGDAAIDATEKFISKTGEDEDLRYQTATEAVGWYEGIVKDIFG